MTHDLSGPLTPSKSKKPTICETNASPVPAKFPTMETQCQSSDCFEEGICASRGKDLRQNWGLGGLESCANRKPFDDFLIPFNTAFYYISHRLAVI